MPRTIFACSYINCSSTFRHRERYEHHLRVHSGERPFICSYDNCDKSYRRLSHLKRHEDVHGSKYKCPAAGCYLTLLTKCTLKKHMETCHAEEVKCQKKPKKYKCDICQQIFQKHSALVKHNYLHTGTKPYVCTEPNCGKGFLMPCKLKQHMQHHKGYTCKEPNCGKLCFKWTEFRTHMKQCHAKTYKCQICEKEFSLKTNLKGHSLTHKEEVDIFNCPFQKCIRFYKSKEALNQHLRYFHAERPLPCPNENCYRYFKTENEMTIHIKWRHQPRRKNKKVAPKPKPEFAAVLAGLEEGTKKDLNPHIHWISPVSDSIIKSDNGETTNSTNICQEDNDKTLFHINEPKSSFLMLKEKYENAPTLRTETVM